MARRKKQEKINEVRNLPNVFSGEGAEVGKGLRSFFANENPLILEAGCGNGEYSVAMAKAEPNRNYIGIDVKPARVWNAAKSASNAGVENAAFIVGNINRLPEYLGKEKIEQIWLPFPDPFLKKRKEKYRLVAPNFLVTYQKILCKGGCVILKTDETFLYEYGLEVLQARGIKILKATDDLYSSDHLTFAEQITTKYEKLHIAEGDKIKLIKFCFE